MTKKNKSADAANAQTKAPEPAIKATKAAAVIALLSRAEGATIEAITEATGWQAHSVQGFMSGTLKKKLGKTVTSEKTEAGRVYRIVDGATE